MFLFWNQLKVHRELMKSFCIDLFSSFYYAFYIWYLLRIFALLKDYLMLSTYLNHKLMCTYFYILFQGTNYYIENAYTCLW